MGRILDTVTGFVTAPGAVFTPWTLATGDSLAVRAATPNTNIWLIGAWAWNQVAGVMRVRSPRMHDNVQGIRMRTPVNLVNNRIPVRLIGGAAQKLFTQDTLIVEQTGSAVAGQSETGSLLIWYDDVPGVSARTIDQATLKKAGVNPRRAIRTGRSAELVRLAIGGNGPAHDSCAELAEQGRYHR